MNIVAFIPARMGSSRFYGKPLASIHGLPMVAHVALRTRLAQGLSDTVVATCDKCIAENCQKFGIQSFMTSSLHERCSDRVAEALLLYEAQKGQKVDIVVMVQGDEPMVTPSMIDAAIAPMLADSSIPVVNLMATIKSLEEFEDPNEVKVVVDTRQRALYFSREPIPSRKKGAESVPMLKQVCIIPFRRDALLRFNALPEGSLEQIESIDMIRFLEHGEQVQMVHIAEQSKSVDTQCDLDEVVQRMENDPLFPLYIPSALQGKKE